MKTKFLFITLLLLINNGTLISQPQKRLREVAARQEINQYFQDYYSGMYRVGDIVDIDSLRGDKKYLYKSIQNPYGMLTNSFVFVTDVNIDYYEGMDGNRVGIYKEGNILWLSEPEFPGGGGGRIFAIDDINLDGTVEIITEWDYGVVLLEIYSWDGVSGKLLNSEPIIGKEFNMSFVDVEGDGILEIISVDRSQVSDVWSWNGSEYGQWSNTPVVSLSELYPANNFIPHIRCIVTKYDSIFNYSYTIKNDEQSKQRIELFWVKADVEENHLIKKSSPYWVSSGYSNNLEGWETPVLNNGYLIWPGDLEEGFKFIINALPTIVLYAMQAHNSLPDFYLLSQQETITLMEKDLTENMVWGETIGPKDIDTPFIPSEFLDSLINYNQRSSELGWIINQATADKYDSLFNLAKTQLQQNNNNAARTTIQSVLHEVNIDSTGNLKSEAYALLRYNTEYLLEQIPAGGESISTYSILATHGVWLEQNSEVISGSIGVNEIGLPPFMDSGVELSIGISTVTPAGYTIKANRIKVKQNATVNSDVYYNELENNGTIAGSLNTPLELPLFTTLPEFKTSTPGTQNINVAQNGVQILQPGSYNNIDVKRYGKLIFTGGEYHINKLTAGDDNQLLFQSESEVRIKDKFDSGQGTYIGAEDTTTLSSDEIIFYVEGINGNNGNLVATPKAAKIGISNKVKANFYVPNGTLWLRQNSEVEGAFIGKDVDVGIGVKVKLSSAF